MCRPRAALPASSFKSCAGASASLPGQHHVKKNSLGCTWRTSFRLPFYLPEGGFGSKHNHCDAGERFCLVYFYFSWISFLRCDTYVRVNRINWFFVVSCSDVHQPWSTFTALTHTSASLSIPEVILPHFAFFFHLADFAPTGYWMVRVPLHSSLADNNLLA